MKIKNIGNKDAIWWVGKTIKCEPCGREIELELSDKSNPLLYFIRDVVGYQCEICNNTVTINNHTKSTLITENAPTDPNIVISKTDESTVQVEPPKMDTSPRSARVGNKVTEGWSNPFAGTSWGSDRPATSLGR